MASCLGIYFSDNSMKYAKLVTDNGGNVRLDHYGTRIATSTKKEIIDNIIAETSSKDIPVVTNILDERFIEVSIFDQAQETEYSPDIMKLEFETWCENNQKVSSDYEFVYKLSKYRTAENKHNGVLCIAPKNKINELKKDEELKIEAIYPSELMYTDLAPDEAQNYIIVNLNEYLTVETVINRKMYEFKVYNNTGMKRLLDEFQLKLGSYSKAYAACKQLNVYTEGENTNDPELERIAEPILQDVLRKVASTVTANKDTISKVYVTGMGIILNNIDVLMTEYLEIKTEIFKPNFLQNTSDVRSVSEMLETIEPMVMAYNHLNKKNKFLNYLHSEVKEKKKNSISSFFENFKKNVSFKKKEKKQKQEQVAQKQTALNTDTKEKHNIKLPEIETNVVLNVLISFATFAVVAFIAYSAFSGIYTATTNKMIADINSKINSLTQETAKVNSDVSYINTNATEYKEINDDVDMLLKQIETGEIGKISTYNVAAFLQKLIKVIPKGVTLDTVKSDDNKNVTISMYSAKYADLGYFVAQLKLEGILNSVEVKNITNATDKITIEIGGELP